MPTVDPQTWLQLGLALALGLFVGLEREQSGHSTGIRTFPLIALFGACAALLVEPTTYWLLPAGLVMVGAGLVATSRGRELIDPTDEESTIHEEGPGPTTLVAAMVMYLLGAMLVSGYLTLAVAIGGTTAVLLHWKKPLHQFVDRLGSSGSKAVYRFVLIALVVLPVLPDRTYGPYDVLNPFRIWLIVGLIVGISVAGYIVYKFLGGRVGLAIGGVLGGIVSSTAATVAYSRQSDRAPATSTGAAVAIMIASTLAFVRIIVEVLVVAPDLRWVVLPKFGLLIAIMAAASVGAYFWADVGDDQEGQQPEDPAALKVAFIFGALYALILFAVAVAEEHFGDTGMYVIATISGLTDVDAITLSTAEMMGAGRISTETGWRMMMVGGLSNVVFKGAVAATIGSRRLAIWVAALFGVTLVSGAGILWLWPAG